MAYGALTLGDEKTAMIEVACDACGRYGRFRRGQLLAKRGPDQIMPDLLKIIAREAGCPKVAAHRDYDRCKARYGRKA